MAAGNPLYAKVNRRLKARQTGANIDSTFLVILMILLAVGLTMLYSASYAQS